jgi:uncharacterized protein
MHISQEFGNASYIIRAYDQGTVIVNDTTFTRSLIIMPESLHADWEPQTLAGLYEVHLETITNLEPELVILGTGPKFVIPAAAIQAFFLKRGIGFEFMDTGAACRTYNVLMAEGRNVACALLIR